MLDVKQRAAERLTHGGLIGRQVASARQRDGGLVMMTGLEQGSPALEQVIDVVHSYEFMTEPSIGLDR
jgi:hypothetical protein